MFEEIFISGNDPAGAGFGVRLAERLTGPTGSTPDLGTASGAFERESAPAHDITPLYLRFAASPMTADRSASGDASEIDVLMAFNALTGDITIAPTRPMEPVSMSGRAGFYFLVVARIAMTAVSSRSDLPIVAYALPRDESVSDRMPAERQLHRGFVQVDEPNSVIDMLFVTGYEDPHMPHVLGELL